MRLFPEYIIVLCILCARHSFFCPLLRSPHFVRIVFSLPLARASLKCRQTSTRVFCVRWHLREFKSKQNYSNFVENYFVKCTFWMVDGFVCHILCPPFSTRHSTAMLMHTSPVQIMFSSSRSSFNVPVMDIPFRFGVRFSNDICFAFTNYIIKQKHGGVVPPLPAVARTGHSTISNIMVIGHSGS